MGRWPSWDQNSPWTEGALPAEGAGERVGDVGGGAAGDGGENGETGDATPV